ncbi:MAG: hypothetical protein RMJ38_02525, partial [candidate division WOR-3 bacterium]|nr:hypothetical protein [candidate division WOR-3 bacterium]MDW8150302.1 hypothetical protein [candidate division WOR-3 bacterium]
MKLKRKNPLKRYEIYKAIKNGWSFKKILNTFKVSTKTVWDIKRNGFYKSDRTIILVNTIREKYPYFTLKQIKYYLKENYNLDIQISTIYYKTCKTIDRNLYKLIKLLLNDGETEYAVKILEDFLFIQWEYLEVLEKIEDEKLSMSLLADKYYYLLYTGKLTSLNEALVQAENYLKICKDKNLNYSYYKWFNIKIRILQALGKYREVLEIFNYEEIIKLPFNLKSYIFAVVVSCGIKLGDKKAINLLNFYKRRFSSKRNRNSKISKDYKLFLRNQYASLGKFNLALKYMDEPFLHFWIGNYRKFFRIKEELPIEMKIPMEVSLAICYLFSKNFFGFLKIADRIQYEVKSFPAYSDEVSLVLALKEVFWGKYNNAIEIISKSNSKILRCISNKDYSMLSKYRKIE